MIHDFIVFDCGVKKLCRQNQYFGVKCAQKRIQDGNDGIIWHTQGSGKSLTMVWLAKWYKEFYPDGRVLVITDRVELDEQIEGVFAGVGETIIRTKSGSDLIERLDKSEDRLICSLVHKFGCATKPNDNKATDEFIENLKKTISKEFSPKGKILVFVDECHRTQSGKLHEAMKEILPNLKMLGISNETPNKEKVAEQYEKEVKDKFKKEPNNMKLLIVVDKLLTGFDAPSATYLYIDKKMQDHTLFQAVCRVNRLDGETKDYGYIVDYKDLFNALEKSVHDYTSNAFEKFDADDIVGLLKDRKEEARADLDKAIERIDSICEDVREPRTDDDYRDFFGCQFGDDEEFYNKKRLNMYKAVNSLIRAYANFKSDILDEEYGYTPEVAKQIDEKVAN